MPQNYFNYPQYGGMNNPYQNIPYNSFRNDYNQRYEIVKVNGRNGAEAYNMPPNSSILLLDETSPLIWLAQTDGAGYKTVTPYSITPYQAEPIPDYNTLEARIKRLEELLNEQPNNANAKPKITTDTE